MSALTATSFFSIGTTPTPDDLRRLSEKYLRKVDVDANDIRRVDTLEGHSVVGNQPRSRDLSGLVIPNCEPGAGGPRSHVIRRDNPEIEVDAPTGERKDKNKYIGSVGSNHLFFDRRLEPQALQDVDLPVLLTEGEFKTIAAHRAATEGGQLRYVAIGLRGAWNFRGRTGKVLDADGKYRDEVGMLPDFNKVASRGRIWYIAFDADIRRNHQVRQARRELTLKLRERGAKVRFVEWDEERGKGLDDFLYKEGASALFELLELARSVEVGWNGELRKDPGDRPLTELGNAERLIAMIDGEARYCAAFKKWLIYDGIRYKFDEDGEVDRRAKRMIRNIPLEAASHSRLAFELRTEASAESLTLENKKSLLERAGKADNRAKEISKWAVHSETAKCIGNLIRLATTEEGVPVSHDDLDSDPMLLNLQNGTFDLRAGRLLSHSRDRLITKIAGARVRNRYYQVSYDPKAKCPTWLRFLEQIFPEQYSDVIPFLRRAVGYSLTGDTREDCFFLLWGKTRGGKGSIISTLTTLLGEYAGTAAFSSFLKQKDDTRPREDIAALVGKRFVAAQENDKDASLAEAVIKGLTGGDVCRPRRLHENGFEFLPAFKIWLGTNNKPKIVGADMGIWSRIKLIPFTVSFLGREDKTLKDRLLEELPGILNWAIAGCEEWQSDGLGTPDSVVQANDDYRRESDQLQRFIDECCVVGPTCSVRAADIYDRYVSWTQRHNEKECKSGTAFGTALTEKFPNKQNRGKGNVYFGIGILTLQHIDP